MLRLALTLVLSTVAACGGKPTPSPTPTAAVPPAPAENEAIAGISLGDAAAEVVAALGEPASKGEVVEWEATGDRTASWKWSTGVRFEMAELDGGAGFVVHSMHVEAPSTLTTSRGVGIGTPYAEVDRIYAPFRGQGREEGEPEQWSVDDGIIVGSVYGGTFFNFTDGKVSTMFVGAGAE